jgi:hypothetical protein
MPFRNGNATETHTLKRFAVRKKTDSLLYNMGAMLAGMGMGFDIRLSNSSMLHPRLQSSASAGAADFENRPGGGKRDAYLAAVRDSFLSPQADSSNIDDFPFSPGFSHHTYHGQQTKYRPCVNFDVPIRFTESDTGYCTQTTDTHTTPSSDQRTTPSADSRTTPSLSGTSFSGGTPSPLPRGGAKSSSASTDDYAYEMALISLSPSTDKAFLQYQRQMSGDSGSVFETPRTTPKTTPQKYNVKFEEGIDGSGAPLSTSTPPLHQPERRVSDDGSSTPTALRPPPPRRPSTAQLQHEAPPERPVTLDIIPRPRPQGILKRSSPIHKPAPGGVTPTPSDSLSAGDDYGSAKSGPSPCPGSTPPHIEHHRTLLDIDMEGQKRDPTRPLPAAKPNQTLQPTISELEREFLS